MEGAEGTSGAAFPVPETWTPANVGGGFDGAAPAAWASATAVADNGLTWVCLTKVDFPTWTAAMRDNSAWPFQTVPGPVIQFTSPPTFQIWYGGAARRTYHAGHDGEADPMPMQDHIDYVNDWQPHCMGGDPIDVAGCNGMTTYGFWFVRPAPGDGHVERRPIGWQSDPATRVDPALGVTFFSDSPGNDNPGTGAPIGFSDSFGTFTNIQFQSKNWLVCASHGFYRPGNQHTNMNKMDQCVMQSDAGPGVMAIDAGWSLNDSAIIYLGTTPGAFGICAGYNLDATRTVFSAPNHPPNGIAIAQQNQYFSSRSSMRDSHFVGFAHDWAYHNDQAVLMDASGNVTDLPASYVGGPVTLSLDHYGVNFVAAPLPGRVP